MALIWVEHSEEPTNEAKKMRAILDEAVWQAWIKKNKAQDKFRFARRLKVMCFAVVSLLVVAVLWRFTS